MIPAYDPEVSCRVLGFPTNQNRFAFPAWSYAIEKYRPDRIIEIGSNNGGFTIALAAASYQFDTHVTSWDIMEAPTREWKHWERFLNIGFSRGDVFQNVSEIGAHIQRTGKTFLLCDGGDKAREFNEFAKYLKPGDVIGAHDYCCHEAPGVWCVSEITQDMVCDAVRENDLEPFHQDIFDAAAWLVYRKI